MNILRDNQYQILLSLPIQDVIKMLSYGEWDVDDEYLWSSLYKRDFKDDEYEVKGNTWKDKYKRRYTMDKIGRKYDREFTEAALDILIDNFNMDEIYEILDNMKTSNVTAVEVMKHLYDWRDDVVSEIMFNETVKLKKGLDYDKEIIKEFFLDVDRMYHGADERQEELHLDYFFSETNDWWISNFIKMLFDIDDREFRVGGIPESFIPNGISE